MLSESLEQKKNRCILAMQPSRTDSLNENGFGLHVVSILLTTFTWICRLTVAKHSVLRDCMKVYNCKQVHVMKHFKWIDMCNVVSGVADRMFAFHAR